MKKRKEEEEEEGGGAEEEESVCLGGREGGREGGSVFDRRENSLSQAAMAAKMTTKDEYYNII